MILFYWEFIFLLKSLPQCQLLFYSQDVREGEQSPLDSTLVEVPELQGGSRELTKKDRETAGEVDFFLNVRST